MTSPMLFDEGPIKARIFKVYDAMKQKAKPRLWKSGNKRGRIRVPGLTALPFTKEQLWQLALKQIGTGAIRCPYCVDIGKPANIIDLISFVFDHRVPRAYAGAELTLLEVWSLDNLVCVCADCNTLKGKLSLPFFIGIMTAIEKWEDPRDRNAIYACLRTHGVVMQGWKGGPKKDLTKIEDKLPTTGSLALKAPYDDSW